MPMKEYLILSVYLEKYDVYVKEAKLLPYMITTDKGNFPLNNREYQMLLNFIEEYSNPNK